MVNLSSGAYLLVGHFMSYLVGLCRDYDVTLVLFIRVIRPEKATLIYVLKEHHELRTVVKSLIMINVLLYSFVEMGVGIPNQFHIDCSH